MSNFDLFELGRIAERCQREPIAIGIALSPKTKAIIERQFAPIQPNLLPFHYSSIMGIPYIVDPRMGDISELYYDEKVWIERCKEQRK